MLAALMLFTAVASTGCSKGENNDKNEASGIVTLNMFIITEDETSPEAAREVQMAINEITVPQHKMLVKINYLKADEYWDAVDAAEAETVEYISSKNSKASEAARLKAIYLESLEEKDEAETEESAEAEAEAATETSTKKKKTIAEMNFNDAIDAVFEMSDVVLDNPQIDIILVDSYDKFTELVEDERISEIDIKYDRKIVTQYIHPTILSTTTVDGDTMGIPANAPINGEYEFLVFNKNLLDKYGYTVHDLKTIESMGDYFALIKANEPGVYPISAVPELSGAEIYDDILFAQSKLDSISSSSFPIYLNNSAYMAYLKAVENYKKNGYIAEYAGAENAKCAVELVKSSKIIDREWTDENGVTYQAYLYDIPRVTAEEAFSSAFCVSSQSLNKSKAAELIELFTINSELANLLQYGIEGTHYRLEDGVVTYLETEPEKTYKMNNEYTGNMYIKYETEDTVGSIEEAKAGNLSTAPSAFFGYTPNFNDNAADRAVYECVKLFSATALENIANGTMTVDEVFNIAARQLNALGCVWDSSGSNLLGVFGKLASSQSTTAKQNTSSFFLAEEAETYNDVYKSAEEIAAELAAEEAAKAAEEAEKLAAEEAALQARIDAENAKNAEEEEPDPTVDDTVSEDETGEETAE